MNESNHTKPAESIGKWQESSHTPTPWFIAKAIGRGELPDGSICVGADIEYRQPECNSGGAIVCVVAPAHRVTATDAANAAFIVRACNSMGRLDTLVGEYRESMDVDVLRAWAANVVSVVKGTD